MMKAVVHDRYGSADEVLRVRDVDKPTPKDDEVLIRVRAASMHPDVWHVVAGLPYLLRLMGNGVTRPKKIIPGTDLAGQVESVGKNVTQFKAGDEVFGESTKFGWHNGGAYAEFAAVPQMLLALKPTNVTFEQAAAVPTAGFIALSNLGAAGSLAGRHLLINGAGGCMGPLALQIAKAEGARVTAVDTAEKLPMLRSLGADHTIDYTREDFLQSGERFDFILDVASTLWFDVCAHALTPTGVYVPIGHANYGKATGRMGGRIVGSVPTFVGLLLRQQLSKNRKNFTMLRKPDAMATFKRLLESGKLTPIVARTFPLSEVATAMRLMQEGHTVGRLILVP
ncbi:MAG: NAD(P)-dependent alcohol dehydrogenase [Vicinamibacterales bacterium]